MDFYYPHVCFLCVASDIDVVKQYSHTDHKGSKMKSRLFTYLLALPLTQIDEGYIRIF